MPKYKIREEDNTGTLELGQQPNVIYVPGAASEKTAPKMYTSLSAFKADVGTVYTADDSALLAMQLLRLGMHVLYQGFVATEGAISIEEDDWKELEDKNLYDVRFLTTGAYACPTNAMIATAANRGDCIALIDHPTQATYDVGSIREYFEGFASATSSKQADPLAFATGFTPWLTANLSDKDGTAVSKSIPASFGYLFAYARSLQTNPLWKAVAGVFRGVIPELSSVAYVYNNAECEQLQARASTGEVDLDEEGDNAGIAINPIAYRRYNGFAGGFNYVICGNRTMHVNAGYTIATSFLNVRLLISELSKALYNASIVYTFEQNTDVLWANFSALITPILDNMQAGEGINGYRIDRIPTTKKARLCARVTIVPVEAVEDFELTISLEDSIEVTE